MQNPLFMNTLTWAGAAAAALVLAFAAPSESNVMGKLPSLTAKRLDQQQVPLPQGLPSDRTLALVVFSKRQNHEVESWIQGLRLTGQSDISWVRMPVLDDPGHAHDRNAIETRLLARYPTPNERSRMMPVFTDRAAFIRSVGLDGPHSAYAIVVNRNGDVLARAQGEFDVEKADALLETLQQH